MDAAVYEAALLLQKGREVVVDGHMYTAASRHGTCYHSQNAVQDVCKLRQGCVQACY